MHISYFVVPNSKKKLGELNGMEKSVNVPSPVEHIAFLTQFVMYFDEGIKSFFGYERKKGNRKEKRYHCV